MHNVIFILLCACILAIYKMYQTPTKPKNIIIMTYLYVVFSLLFIAAVSKYTESLQITNSENTAKLVILYFILAFSGIWFMISQNSITNHAGFLLLLIGISLTIGSMRKYATNIEIATKVSAAIFILFTMFVFFSSEQTIAKMANWSQKLSMLLICLIFIDLLGIVFFSYDQQFYNMIACFGIALFVGFILSDTSRLIIKAKTTLCHTHSCIDYPLEASSLMLNYINIFVNLLSNK